MISPPHNRIVWMPKELKDDVGERLNKTAKEMYGIDNFTDMVADETGSTARGRRPVRQRSAVTA